MPPEELLAMIQRRPFVPFLIRMRDGTVYEIRHPELLMVGRRSAIIGFPERPGELLMSRHETIALLHIVRMEPLETHAAPH